MTDSGWMAEAIERARFDQLRQGKWDELREGERTTRVQILREALLASGVAAEIDALRAQAERTGLLLDLVNQRDLEAAANLARHDEEIVRLSDTIADLIDQVGDLTHALAVSEARAEAAENIVTAVRDAVAPLSTRGSSRH